MEPVLKIKNRSRSTIPTQEVIVCPFCLGVGTIRLEHSGEYEECSYCNGNRVVIEKTFHVSIDEK